MTYTQDQKKALRETNPFDERNILDHFKGMPTQKIQEHMTENSLPMISITENLVGDFNISQIVRTSNVFGIRGVAIAGGKKWDRRGAVGAHHYIDVSYYSSSLDAINYYRKLGYRIIAAELTDDAIALSKYNWIPHVAVVYGEEGKGISDEALENVDDVVYIPQRGTVRSLNVASAAAIIMYDYVNRVI